MTDALPKGLVTTSEAITGDIESIDYVAIEDIAQLWKVYTTNKAVFDGLVGPRLEYFFWRIWSSPRLHHNITGSTVARGFLRISEGPSSIRTTPTQSPALTRKIPSIRSVSFDLGSHHADTLSYCQKISPPHEPFRAVPPSDPSPAREEVADVDLAPPLQANSRDPGGAGAVGCGKPSSDFSGGRDGTPASSRKDQRSVPFLPPILKKPRAGSQNQLPKTARVISPAFDDSIGRQSGSDESSSASDLAIEPPTAASGAAAGVSVTAGSATSAIHAVRSPASPSPGAEKGPVQKPPKKRTAFVANTGSTRRRPSAGRRQSSQSSSGSASKVTSPPLAAQAQQRTIPEASILELPRSSLPDTPGLALSPLSRTLILATAHPPESQLGRASSAIAVAGERSHQDWLVERDLRSRFVDRRRHENVTPNLTRPAPKAPATAAAAVSFQAAGMMDSSAHPPAKGKGKGKGKVEIVPLKPDGSAGSAAMEDDETIPTASLRQSTSQLTLVLDRDRRSSESTSSKRGQEREKHRKSSS